MMSGFYPFVDDVKAYGFASNPLTRSSGISSLRTIDGRTGVSSDGVAYYSTLTDNLIKSGSFSVSCWVKINNDVTGGILSQTIPFGTEDDVTDFGNNYTGWELTYGQTGIIGFELSDGTDITSGSSYAPNVLTKWTHIACVYNSGEGSVRIYVNGILDPNSIATGTFAGTTAGSGTLNIGATRHSISTYYGYPDEYRISDSFINLVRLFPVALSDGDIQRLYGRERNVLGYHPRYLFDNKPKSSFSLYLTGSVGVTKTSSMFMVGGGPSKFTSLHLQQLGPITNTRSLLLTGDTTTPRIPNFTSQLGTIDSALSQFELGANPYGPRTGVKSLFLRGSPPNSNLYNAATLYIHGKTTKQSGISLIISDKTIARMSMFLMAAPKLIKHGASLAIRGTNTAGFSRGISLYMGGQKGQKNSSIPLFLKTPSSGSNRNSTSLYLYGQGISKQNAIPLFISTLNMSRGSGLVWSQWNPVWSLQQNQSWSGGGILWDNDQDLWNLSQDLWNTSGFEKFLPNAMPLTIIGEGPIAASGGTTLFIKALFGGQMSMYLNGPGTVNTGSIPLFINPSLPLQNQISLVLPKTVATPDVDNPLFLFVSGY